MRCTIILALAALAACRSNDLGTGVNTLDRSYSKPAGDTWKAAVAAVEAADLRIERKSNDAMGGEIVARRADCNEVRISVKAQDDRNSTVAVRVDPGDRDLAAMLHERIADRLGMGKARSSLLGGGASDTVVYCCDLPESVRAARKAYAALDIGVTDEESHATWVRLDGRLKDSTPVQIRMEEKEGGKTQVVFIAGNTRNEDMKLIARRLKDEFERHCRGDRESE